MAKTSNRKEAWMRIIVMIVSGIILCAWSVLIRVFLVINWVMGVFANKRLKSLAELSEIWNTQVYDFVRYMNFVSNKRPFPFEELRKSISRFE